MAGRSNTPHVSQRVARLAARQDGAVGRAQLRSLGLSRGVIDEWVASGRLWAVHRGVYAVGHEVLTDRGRMVAALLACGPGATLSHRTAGALWRIREWPSPSVELTTAGGPRRRNRITVHRTRHLPPEDTTRLNGLPVTSVNRTLIDLAEVLNRRALERTLDEANYLRLLDLTSLAAAVEDAKGRRGAANLRQVLQDHRPGSTRTRSELEEAFLALCDRHHLPRPEVNTRKSGYEVDFTWPDSALIVETDGRAAHGTARAFERDHEKQVELALADRPVLRFTYRQITERPGWVARKVREGYSRSRRSNASSVSGDGRSKKSGLRQSKASP